MIDLEFSTCLTVFTFAFRAAKNKKNEKQEEFDGNYSMGGSMIVVNFIIIRII